MHSEAGRLITRCVLYWSVKKDESEYGAEPITSNRRYCACASGWNAKLRVCNQL